MENPVKTGGVRIPNMTYLLKTVPAYAVKTAILTLILLAGLKACTPAHAQGDLLDSVRHILQNMPDDTSKVNAYYRLGERFERKLPDTALSLYRRGYDLAVSLGFQKGKAAFSSYAIEILNAQGKFKEALEIARNALTIYEQVGSRLDLAKALLNVGSEWHYLSDFQQASDYYLRALKIMNELKQPFYQRMLGNNLASIFINLGQYQKGKEYAERSLVIARQLGQDYPVSSSMFNVATAELYLKQYDSALSHYREIERLGQRMSDYIVILDGRLGIADVYNAMNRASKAGRHYQDVIRYSQENKAPEYEMYAYMGAADSHLKSGQLAAADKMIKKGIDLALAQGSLFELKDLYKKGSEVAEKKLDYVQALELRKKFEVLNDSVTGEKSRSNIEMLEARFESENKAATIRQLEAEKQIQILALEKKNTWNFLLAGAVIVVAIILLLVYRNNKQKHSLQEEHIARLQQEKQLLATEAVLKGEEQERARLAKDLHDGLGGMLSGLKYNLNNMKGNQIMTAENQAAFERSLEMLDRSIREMRRVAHNMMPEALLRFGLDTALRDFCNDISLSKALPVKYQSFGMHDVSIDQTRAISIYRIVQELITNSVKHAHAKAAIVQLTHNDGRISLTVEDDGSGFDPAVVKATSGIGWTNIRSRVEFLQGKLDVTSDSTGTSVHIEL